MQRIHMLTIHTPDRPPASLAYPSRETATRAGLRLPPGTEYLVTPAEITITLSAYSQTWPETVRTETDLREIAGRMLAAYQLLCLAHNDRPANELVRHFNTALFWDPHATRSILGIASTEDGASLTIEIADP